MKNAKRNLKKEQAMHDQYLVAQGAVKMLFALVLQEKKGNAEFIRLWLEGWVAALVETGYTAQEVQSMYAYWQSNFEENHGSIESKMNAIFFPKKSQVELKKEDRMAYLQEIASWAKD